MVDDAIDAGSPSAASPATEVAAQDAVVLSELTELALGLARGFQAQGVAALDAGDLDRAGEAETRFSSLFLGIRRAIALKMKLREQHEKAQREAESHKDRRRDEKDRRRQTVAERVSRAIAAEKPEAKERLTAELWERLAEDERIDADLADTALPIEILIQRLRRDIGLSRRALDPDGTAGADAAGPKSPRGTAGRAAAAPPPQDPSFPDEHFIWASDLGGPEGEYWRHDLSTGEVFDWSGNVVRTLPISTQPRRCDPTGTAPPAPDPRPPPDRRT
ncbi:hypothetical protein QFZ27_005150 [Inquilinus ginsengisoli]|uniref:hypothetical protein n=1 Tax=Inquilinus ginsengisoli TaxID=363840 RepID=UPI003D240F16